MSKLYNPELIPKEEIKRTFVGRHKLIEEIISIVKTQPKGAGIQHVVIIAPRGMGKTTLLLMLRFEIEDSKLSKSWQPVQFPEESYDIYELSDFWIKVGEYLSADTGDDDLRRKFAEIKVKYPRNEDLNEIAFALLKDWRREHQKQLLLLIDNFDMILEQINDEQDTARLRKVLMNDDTVMLIGSSLTFFQEIRGYDHPLYNFFKLYNLAGFDDEEIKAFLLKRADEDGIADFEELFSKNRARIKTLTYFTDGNPRLILMLFDVITRSKLGDVEKALESLLDEVTPYFKSKIEVLPPQQRKVLDYIAKMSFEKREGVTPSEISAEIRLSPNQTSAQLKRLAEDSFIKAANVSGRSSFYVMSEPLVAIWYQMRFGRAAYQKRRWLITILRALYDREELQTEHEKLQQKYSECFVSGQTANAQEILKHQLYVTEAMAEGSGTKEYYEHFISESLHLKNETLVKDELKNPALLKNLSPKVLLELFNKNLIEKSLYQNAIAQSAFDEGSSNESDSMSEWVKGEEVMKSVSPETRPTQMERALAHFNLALELNPANISALFSRSSCFYTLGRFGEAIADSNKLIEIFTEELERPGNKERADDLARAFMNKGVSLARSGKLNEAITEYEKAIEILARLVENGQDWDVSIGLARTYLNKTEVSIKQKNFQGAKDSLNKAITLADSLRYEDFNSWILDIIFSTVKGDDFSNLRKLIDGGESENRFFPILRAVEFLETNDQTLIEKLSPEVRGVVEESIRQLKKATHGETPPGLTS